MAEAAVECEPGSAGLHVLHLQSDGGEGLMLELEAETNTSRSGGADPPKTLNWLNSGQPRRARRKWSQAGGREVSKTPGESVAGGDPDPDPEDPAPTVKCTSVCGKKRPLEDFSKDQKRCKECVGHLRAFWRHAAKQESTEDMKALEQEDPAAYKDMLRNFCKERSRAAAADGKIRFAFMSFKKSIQSKSGDRRENEKVMMWEGQWKEEARLAPHGYLTQEEADAKWKLWLADKSVVRDNDGPRGYLRLAVPTRTVLSGYTDLSDNRELEQSERLSRKAAESTVQDRARMVISGSANEEANKVNGLDLEKLRSQARAAGLDTEEAVAPNLAQAAEAAKKRRRLSSSKRKNGDDREDEESGSSDAESDNAARKDDADAQEEDKWFDAETKCRKAERAWLAGVESFEKSLVDLRNDCAGVMSEFRSLGAGSAAFQEEMAVLDRRARWLDAVLQGDDCLSKVMDEQIAEEHKALDESKTNSQDAGALTRVGPCKDYKELRSVQALKQMSAEFRTCGSNKAIKDLNEAGGRQKKSVQTLCAAVKAAKGDLVAAKKRQEAAKKKEEDKAAKAAKNAQQQQGREKNGPGPDPSAKAKVSRQRLPSQSLVLDSNSELWQKSGFQIRALAEPAQHSLGQESGAFSVAEPFIQSGVMPPDAVSRSVGEFRKVFASSALRVTEGRAQIALSAGGDAFVQQLVSSGHMPTEWRSQVTGQGGGGQALAALASALRPSCFGIAASSVSAGRTELAMLPCWRLICEGSLMIAVLTPKKFERPDQMAAAQRLMTAGTQQEVLQAANSGELRVATVGKGDLLFLPPACVVTHKAHATDVLGLRLGVLGHAFSERLTKLVAVVTSLPPPMLATIKEAIQEQEKPPAATVAAQSESQQKAGVEVEAEPSGGDSQAQGLAKNAALADAKKGAEVPQAEVPQSESQSAQPRLDAANQPASPATPSTADRAANAKAGAEDAALPQSAAASASEAVSAAEAPQANSAAAAAAKEAGRETGGGSGSMPTAGVAASPQDAPAKPEPPSAEPTSEPERKIADPATPAEPPQAEAEDTRDGKRKKNAAEKAAAAKKAKAAGKKRAKN